MSRPRQPFGADHPGRLPATMMKVLAAEMSDPQRLRRGKQYAHDGSVLDIIIEAGLVTCEVQGSRPTPYIAQLEVSPGDGMPLRRHITAHCTCPDADNWDDYACKHAVAAMFALSNELLLEPVLLDVWRQRLASGESEPNDDPPPVRGRGHLTLVHSDTRRTPDPSNREPARDPLQGFLTFPAGSELPPVPALDRLEPRRAVRSDLADVLEDALGHLRIDWD